MILTVTYDSIWCICRCFIRRPELFILDEHMGSPPAFGGVVCVAHLLSFRLILFSFFSLSVLCSQCCLFSWIVFFHGPFDFL